MGRTREFDIDEALDQAMEVFWRKGYDGASLTDLTEAMGVEKPSLYAAFGNKEALFARVLDRYLDGPSGYIEAALAQPTARRVAEALLRGAADLHSDPGSPPGCLIVQGALVCRDDAEEVREMLADARDAGETSVRERLERALEEGDLPPDANPAALATYLRTVTYGMAIRATSGADRTELHAVVDLALGSWPSD